MSQNQNENDKDKAPSSPSESKPNTKPDPKQAAQPRIEKRSNDPNAKNGDSNQAHK